MSDLRVNKVLGAVLATGLVILGLQTVSGVIFETHAPAKPGYAVTIQEAASEGAAAPETPPDWGTVLASADVAAGQTVSAKCASCHTFTNGGANAIGPNLWGVVQRKVASHAGYAYSPGMMEFSGKVSNWDYEHLFEYLKSPQGYVPGTKMTFVGLKKPEDRINLVAWLRMQSDSPAPIPAPNPAAAAAAAAPAAGAAPAGPAPAGATPAATGGAAPTAAAPGAPAQTQTANPTGQTPAAGAAAAPAATKAATPGR